MFYNRGMPKVFASRNQIIQVYIVERLSGKESAKRLNMSRTTFSRYLRRFGIDERSISEAKKGKKLSKEHRDKVVKSLRQFTTNLKDG